MNKKQKLDLLFEGKLPEDEKLFRPILMHFAARHIGRSYAEFASDYKTLVESNLKSLEDFDMDMVGLISDPYRETSAFGARVSFPKEGVPKCEESIVHSLEDVRNLRNPDVYKCERTIDRIKGAELFQQILKGEVPVVGWIEGPLAEACDLTGVSEMLLFLMMDPDLSNMLLDKCVRTAKDFAKAQIEAGCHIIGMGDAICSQIDFSTYNTYVKERHIEIIDFIHENNAKVKLHICGDITHLLPSLKEVGMDIIDLDYEVSMDDAYHILGEEVVRCGNVDPVFIQNASPFEIENKTKEINIAEKGRKHIISAGCEITVNTPGENLLAMRKASI